ncbi:hypothetical protein EN815_35860, partial [Mesorhizobium sp. M4B.F.Ca.ET.172.01.1.1]
RPGYARTIDRVARSAVDETRDLYDNACVLLALAALFAATDRIAYRKQIEILLTAIDTTLADPAGGWAEISRLFGSSRKVLTADETSAVSSGLLSCAIPNGT